MSFFSRRKSVLLPTLAGLIAPLQATEFMPLDDVEVGMQGVWRTVVQGTEIREFELEILGILEDALGPESHLIVAQAITPDQILSGPVAGMSGSPVYVDGKLLGAYSRGWTWSKEQAIIGITPIDDMVDIWDDFSSEASLTTAQLTTTLGEAPQLAPLPAPLGMAGFSGQTMAVFADELAARGVTAFAAPLGTTTTGEAGSFPEMEPGSAVAAVLMQGDFRAAATGTVTWRDGDQVIGFGHPFMQMGETSMPMAHADILTVVRNQQLSFKMSSVGPVVGTISQDRLSGIAGELGPVPNMIPLEISVATDRGQRRAYTAELLDHPDWTPLLSAMAMLQSLTATMDLEEEETFRLQGTVEFANLAPISWTDAGVGAFAGPGLAISYLARLNTLVNHPENEAEIAKISFVLEREQGEARWELTRVQMRQHRIRAGEDLDLQLILQGEDGAEQILDVTVPIPGHLRANESITLFIGRGSALDSRLDQADASALSLDTLADRWRGQRPPHDLHLALIAASTGTYIEDLVLPGLPPSALASLAGETAAARQGLTPERLLWETQLPFDGLFQGRHVQTLTLEK